MNDTTPAPSRRPPRLEEFPHRAHEIARLGDLDHNGHVNNVIFGVYFETGRTMFMREAFGSLQLEGNRQFVVARLEIDFLRELHWPATLEVGTGVERIGARSVTYKQATFHDGVCVAQGRTVMVFIDRGTRRAIPISEDIIAILEAHRIRSES